MHKHVTEKQAAAEHASDAEVQSRRADGVEVHDSGANPAAGA
jgi:hypothetical protein